MAFPLNVKKEALVRCKRHCVLCRKFVGTHIQCHHIVQEADGGDNSFDNCIPLCLDCHASIRAYNPQHPIGTPYSSQELKILRDSFYRSIENLPNNDNIVANLFISNTNQLLTAFVNKSIQYNVQDMYVRDPSVSYPEDLIYNADAFIEEIEGLLKISIILNQTDPYQNIHAFIYGLNKYMGELANLLIPNCNGIAVIISPQKYLLNRELYDRYRNDLHKLYFQITAMLCHG